MEDTKQFVELIDKLIRSRIELAKVGGKGFAATNAAVNEAKGSLENFIDRKLEESSE